MGYSVISYSDIDVCMNVCNSITDKGFVRFPQFLDFYANISAFDDDLKFSEMMKSVWLSPTRGAPVGKLLGESDSGLQQSLTQVGYALPWHTCTLIYIPCMCIYVCMHVGMNKKIIFF